MSTPTKLDVAAIEWLRSMARPQAWAAAEPLLEQGDLMLLAQVPAADGESDTATDASSPPKSVQPPPELWVTGPRARLRSPVTQLFNSRLDETLAWLVKWLEGRWPRGKMVLKLPLGDQRRASWVMHAPMPPTRLLLSQGPLPLSREAVAHFKGFHRALGANHLFSGGFEVQDDTVTRLRAAWRLSLSDLPLALAAWPVPMAPQVQTLIEAYPDKASVTLEADYRPEAGDTIRLTFPGRGRRRMIDVSRGDGGHPTVHHSWLVQLHTS